MTASITNSSGPRDLRNDDLSHEQRDWSFRILRWTIGIGLLSALLYAYSQGHLTQENLQRLSGTLPTWLLIPAFLLLPLLGFPISVALLISAARMGFLGASMLAFVGMAIHTAVAWPIANRLIKRQLHQFRLFRRVQSVEIAEHHQTWMTAVFVTVPGLPYAVKLYSLAISPLSFGRYMVVVWLCHTFNALPVIALGAAATEISPGLFFGLLMGAMVVLFVLSKLRQRFFTTTS